MPAKDKGRPRTFFQDRNVVRDVFLHSGGKPGDVVLFEDVTPYHFNLSLKTAAGKVMTA